MYNLAVAYERQGDYTRAMYWVRKAQEVEPADVALERLDLRLRVLRMWRKLVRAVRGMMFWNK